MKINENLQFTTAKRVILYNLKIRGFTLVELLVVIALIGLLSSIALISFTGVQKQSRDTQRKSDIRQYQLALENFANKSGGLYPGENVAVSADGDLCTDLAMTSCPSDPRKTKDPNFDYKYISGGTVSDGSPVASNYVLWGRIENVSTTTYWIVCSNGKSGQLTTAPSSSTCPI